MWADYIPAQLNPMRKVKVPGISSVNVRERVIMTVEQFCDWVVRLQQPFRSAALLGLCDGLRSCEIRGLKWQDIDWEGSSVYPKRSIVEGNVGDVKTRRSKREMHIPPQVLSVLRAWYEMTVYNKPEDWIFASAESDGKMPISYSTLYRAYREAASKIGIERLGTHALRHSFRAWLDAVNTKPTVTKELMRHSQLDTSFNTYGGIITDEEREAQNRVADMVFGATGDKLVCRIPINLNQESETGDSEPK
jgi:integrase